MPFSFPSSPSLNQQSTQNGRVYQWSGYAWEIVATPASLNASVITAGTLDAARLPLATTLAVGGVIVGTGLGVSSGTVSVTYGTNSTSACRGDDSRLSDTRTPTDGSVTTAKVANDAVTYAKIQNVSATDRILGRSSAGAGDVEEITCSPFGRSLIDDADATAARATLSVQPTASPAFTGTVSAAAANFTGAVSVTSPLTLTGTVAGNVRQLKLQTSGVDRWQITPSVDAETGSNAGSNFHITRWNDAGSFMGTPLYITRSTGIVNCESGLTIVSGQLLVTAGSGSAGSYKPGVAVSGDDDTGLQQVGGANTISLVTAGNERLRADLTRVFINGNGEQYGLGVRYVRTGGAVHFGATSNSATPDAAISNAGGGTLLLAKNSGEILIGQTTTTDPAGANTNGVAIATDYISLSRSSFECLRLNIKAADGTIVALFQDAALEGSISVSGNTVSYNAFCGSHWAQLIDGSRPAILRGTVLETIDEMCEWPEGKSDRLVRVKVSDTPASRRVYGVFMGWDEQYAATGDMYATALGAYMVRVSGDVQSGDLLESAGDGTARAQSDDIVRSSTIGKVSSTHRVAEYDDGSYLVPCVLMCG